MHRARGSPPQLIAVLSCARVQPPAQELEDATRWMLAAASGDKEAADRLPAEARQSLDEAVAMLRRLSSGGSSHLVNSLVQSGLARLDDGDAAAALPELEEALSMAEAILSPEASELDRCRAALVRCQKALALK